MEAIVFGVFGLVSTAAVVYEFHTGEKLTLFSLTSTLGKKPNVEMRPADIVHRVDTDLLFRSLDSDVATLFLCRYVWIYYEISNKVSLEPYLVFRQGLCAKSVAGRQSVGKTSIYEEGLDRASSRSIRFASSIVIEQARATQVSTSIGVFRKPRPLKKCLSFAVLVRGHVILFAEVVAIMTDVVEELLRSKDNVSDLQRTENATSEEFSGGWIDNYVNAVDEKSSNNYDTDRMVESAVDSFHDLNRFLDLLAGIPKNQTSEWIKRTTGRSLNSFIKDLRAHHRKIRKIRKLPDLRLTAAKLVDLSWKILSMHHILFRTKYGITTLMSISRDFRNYLKVQNIDCVKDDVRWGAKVSNRNAIRMSVRLEAWQDSGNALLSEDSEHAGQSIFTS